MWRSSGYLSPSLAGSTGDSEFCHLQSEIAIRIKKLVWLFAEQELSLLACCAGWPSLLRALAELAQPPAGTLPESESRCRARHESYECPDLASMS